MIKKTLSVWLLAAFFTVPGLTAQAEVSEGLKELIPETLVNADGKQVSRESLAGKFVGVYFSAQWCPPCRAFTPKLVTFRNDNKDAFEVVFVSSDQSAKAQKKYMKAYKMDWPAVVHGSDGVDKLKSHFNVRGIPYLAILNPEGEVVSATGRNDIEESPDTALANWKKK